MRGGWVAVAICGVLAGEAAGDTSAAAQFSAGMTAYERGDYATALAAFEATFRIDPRPEVAFTLAQAHRNQYFADKDVTHLHRALGLYRHYLAEAPAGRRAAHARLHLETIEVILASLPTQPTLAPGQPPPTQLLVTADAPGARASVDGAPTTAIPLVIEVAPGRHRIRLEAPGYDAAELEALAVAERLVVVPATLRARPAQLVVRADDAARITVDGRPVEATSRLSPGVHRVAITARGKLPVVRDVELGAGATETLEVDLVSTPRRRAARFTLYGSAGLGAAALIAGGASWLAQRDAVRLYDTRELPDDIDAYQDARARRDTWRAVSFSLATTAGVAAITGAALWYFDEPRPPEKPTIAPVTGPESVGVSVLGRF